MDKLIIIDAIDPDQSKSLIRRIMRLHPKAKVLILTPPCTSETLMRYYQQGISAHLFKPLNIHKLIYTLDEMLETYDRSEIRIGKLIIDTHREKVLFQQSEIDMTRRQYDILGLLAARRGAPVRREYLNLRTCQRRRCSDSNSIDVHVSSLRQKLRQAGLIDDFIETVHGIGYRLRV